MSSNTIGVGERAGVDVELRQLAAKRFPDVPIPDAWIDTFLREVASDEDDLAALLGTRETRARWLCQWLINKPIDDPPLLASLVFLDSLELPTTRLVRREDVRRRLAHSLSKLTADQPPRTPILFDHVSKTGGSTIVAALNFIFPLHVVSPRGDLHRADVHDGSHLQRWPIVCGHIGRRNHKLIPDLARRKLCTVIRDPVSRTRSVYTFFRHNVRSSHPAYADPALVAARELSFADFIRHEAARARIEDQQFRTLNSLEAYDGSEARNSASRASASVRDVLDVFDVVGVTDRMSEFFDALLRTMDVSVRIESDELLRLCYRRRSRGTVEVSDEDRQYILALNPLDSALHAEASRRAGDTR